LQRIAFNLPFTLFYHVYKPTTLSMKNALQSPTRSRPLGNLVGTVLTPLLLICLSLAVAFAAEPDILERTVTLKVEKRELQDVLSQLEKLAQVTFAYSPKVIQLEREVSFDVKNQKLSVALEKLLKPLHISYEVVSGRILLSKANGQSTEQSHLPVLPGKLAMTITGRVVDDQQQGLPGVNVVLKGTSTGAVTNTEGNYSLVVPDGGGTLVFSFIGYVNQEVAIGNQTTINVTLRSDIKSLSEVVVVGYGQQKRGNLTGSVAVVDIQTLKSQPAASAVEALQGKAAGVNIVNDGSPGSTPQIRIRGYSTVNNNDPLYIVDGTPYQGNISWLNQNDIESLQVLKDASAASIYGSRANNGVVIITTKKGKEGPPQITFDAYYGVSTPRTEAYPTFLSPLQFAQYQFSAYRNAGQNPGDYIGSMYGTGQDPILPTYLIAGSAVGLNVRDSDADPAKYNYDPTRFYQITKANQAGTDWMRAIMHSAPVQNYQIGASGGSKNSTYSIAAGYLDQQGIIKYTGFKRYTLRANSQISAFKNRLRFGENALFSRTDGVGFATNPSVPGNYNVENNPINAVYKMQPIIPIYDIGGNFAGAKGSNLGDGSNPVALLYRAKDNFRRENRLFGNVFAEVDLLEGLTARTNYAASLSNYNSQRITYPNLEAPTGSGANSYSPTQGYETQWTWTNTLSYKKTFKQDHDVSVLAGTEAIRNTFRDLSASRNGFFLLGDQNYYYLNAGSSNITNSETGSISSLYSLFGRIDYGFRDKYLFSATLRRDGSSNFGTLNRFGYFPAVSGAWRISGEEFAKNLTWVQDLKLRVGYGETGNQNIPANNAVDVYQSLNTSSFYPINGTNTLVPGVRQNQIGNPQLKWEQLKSTNIGIDFTLFNGILDGSLDVYRRITSGMLFPVPLPSQTAGMASSPYVNAGSMRNQGVEVVLNYHYGQKNTGDFKFDVGLNFASNANELLQLAPGINNAPYGNFRSLTTTIFQVGKPYGEFYGYQQAGIFQNAQEVAESSQPGARVGGIKFADANNDGVFSSADRTNLGSPLPQFTYGLNLNFSYRNFDLTSFFYGSQGNKLYNINRYYTDFQVFPSPASTRLLDAWTPTNTNTMVPAPSSLASAIEYQSSSYYIEDGSFFRMKNLQLGYTLKNPDVLKRVGLARVRLYASVTNLFTLTRYSGLDPEISQTNQTFNLPGIDFGVYPNPRQFLIGINAGF
jgi:TonB-linked SusC/RagA family outer membrane protein